MAAALIEVYALLPQNVTLDPDLDVIPSNWHWVHCLTFRLEQLRFLQNLNRYKWIRYAIGVFIGAEGVLSTSSDSPNTMDDNNVLPTESVKLYYHISGDEKRRMFPVDPHIARTCITSSGHTVKKEGFRSEVAQRDGNLCVLTGLAPEFCNAAHLLSHSKGDQYISTYTQRRSRDLAGGDIIRDINDVRNGLFLSLYAHMVLGKDLAFLLTPNFAINTSDIDPAASPTEKRYTSHVFPKKDSVAAQQPFSSGSQLRLSASDISVPPAILLDAVYVGAVLHHFGTQTLKDDIMATWKDTFDPGEAMNGAHADYAESNERRATAKEIHNRERDALPDARNHPDAFDMLMTLPYIKVPRGELQSMLEEAEEKAEVAEQKRVQEKVNAWNRQVTGV